ncbi:MAG: YggT family protein [Pseudomonadota bacterium]
MLATALIFLLDTAADLITVALLLRFFLQWARAAARNPISDFLNALTNWAVRPARRIIPSAWGLDLPTLVVAWLIQFANIFLTLLLRGYELGPASGQAIAAMALLALLALLRLSLYIIMVVLILQAVLSWVNPYSPVAPLLNALSRPFLRPFQRVIPPVANVDLSPLFVIIACQLLLMLPIAYMQGVLTRML